MGGRIRKEGRSGLEEGSGWGLCGCTEGKGWEVVAGQAESSACSHQRLEPLGANCDENETQNQEAWGLQALPSALDTEQFTSTFSVFLV